MRLEPIDSLDDPRLDVFRHVGDPQRIRGEGRFVAEGRRVVADLLGEGARYEIEALLLTRAALAAMQDDLRRLPPDVPVRVVEAPADLREITGYRFHQGCLAIAVLPPSRQLGDLETLGAPGPRLVVVLEGVTDPDNVGTVFRSACAFGADAVVLGPGSAHPLYRKALRTSLGAALRLPFAHPQPWPEALGDLRRAGFRSLALTPRQAATPLTDEVVRRSGPRVAFLLGSEESGLSEALLSRADERVRIETTGGVDSLNVAAAAAIALHRLYAARQ